jgi:hypothetical protein
MATEESKVSYFNTLVFTIVSGIISLLLLLSLFFDFVRQNGFYFVIAVEIGIFSVIAICIFQIMRNESLLNAMRSNALKKLTFTECPDYFVKEDVNGEMMCYNNYSVKDSKGRSYYMRIYPAEEQLPALISQGKEEGVKGKMSLYKIEQTVDFKTGKEQCAVVLQEPVLEGIQPAKREVLQNFVGYSKLPWMHARSRCGPYVDE